MITGVVFWPHPPLLVPAYASAADPGSALRAEALAALAAVPGGRPVLLTGDERSPARAALGERVARALLAVGGNADAGPAAVVRLPFDADPSEVSAAADRVRAAVATAPSTLLVLGDGSACRTTRAPGHRDPRAEEQDAQVAAALATADTAALARLDSDLCAELMIAGRAVWQCAAAVLGDTRWVAVRSWFDDPYEVGYHVAAWRRGRR